MYGIKAMYCVQDVLLVVTDNSLLEKPEESRISLNYSQPNATTYSTRFEAFPGESEVLVAQKNVT